MFRLSSCLAMLSLTALLAAGCQQPVHIPNGPSVFLPQSIKHRTEGKILRIGSGDLSTEQCAVELEALNEKNPVRALERRFASQGGELPLPASHQDDEWRMELPPGNTRHVVLARRFQTQTILLTFCPDGPTQNETKLKNILMHNLEP